MNRNITTVGVVMKAQPFMEADRKILILSPEHGLMEGVVYGIGKGKGRLSSVTDVLSQGDFYLYFEPVKKRLKVTDCEPVALFSGIKEDLYRYFRAVLWVEIVLKSLGGSETYPDVYRLLVTCLTLMNHTSFKEEIDLVHLQFLWRYILLQGYTTGVDRCSRCGREMGEHEAAYYLAGEDPFICRACAGEAERAAEAFAGRIRLREITAGARRYLSHTMPLDLPDVLRVRLDPVSVRKAVGTFHSYLEEIVESPFASLSLLEETENLK